MIENPPRIFISPPEPMPSIAGPSLGKTSRYHLQGDEKTKPKPVKTANSQKKRAKRLTEKYAKLAEAKRENELLALVGVKPFARSFESDVPFAPDYEPDVFLDRLDSRPTVRACACKKCGLPIAFKRLPSGKFCPTNPDGSDHWDACSVAQRAGRPFDPKLDMKSSKWIVGSKFVKLPPLPAGEVPWN